MNSLLAGTALAASTLLSEDAATLTAGALVAAGSMPPASAIAAVALGIWIGDLGLFAAGRLAGRMPILSRWVERRWSRDEMRGMQQRFNRGAALAILGSRFLPGTRVLLYVAAGACRVRTATFATSAAVASIAWTMIVVLSVGSLGAWW